MWRIFKSALLILFVFSAGLGAEMMWPEASPWTWWSIAAVSGLLYLLAGRPSVESFVSTAADTIKDKIGKKENFSIWNYFHIESSTVRFVFDYALFFVIVTAVVPFYVETGGSAISGRFFQIFYRIVGGLMVFTSVIETILGKKETSKADMLKSSAIFVLGCVMMAQAYELA